MDSRAFQPFIKGLIMVQMQSLPSYPIVLFLPYFFFAPRHEIFAPVAAAFAFIASAAATPLLFFLKSQRLCLFFLLPEKHPSQLPRCHQPTKLHRRPLARLGKHFQVRSDLGYQQHPIKPGTNTGYV